jgi:urease accessory protein
VIPRAAVEPNRDTGDAGRRPAHRGWDARLALDFERVGARTVLVRRAHSGPLVVQKPLYAEGPSVCQCVIVHPPAGIVGGDRLALRCGVRRGASVQLTTPAATRWYRTEGAEAVQTLDATLDDDAVLEWLPQGTIVHDGAIATSTTRIALTCRSTFIGADVVSLGRRASGEQFRCGRWRQRFDNVRDGALIWSDRGVLDGGSGLIAASAGLNGGSVFGTFVAVAAGIDDVLVGQLRAVSTGSGSGGVSRLPDVLVARYAGNSMEAASAYFLGLWSLVRPLAVGRPALRPRIWST